jgi:hypothetical protein
MAALVVLIAIAAASGVLLAVYVAICSAIRRADKRGTLRDGAPTMLGQRVQAFTGAHAARWDDGASWETAASSGREQEETPAYV